MPVNAVIKLLQLADKSAWQLYDVSHRCSTVTTTRFDKFWLCYAYPWEGNSVLLFYAILYNKLMQKRTLIALILMHSLYCNGSIMRRKIIARCWGIASKMKFTRSNTTQIFVVAPCFSSVEIWFDQKFVYRTPLSSFSIVLTIKLLERLDAMIPKCEHSLINGLLLV